MGRPMSAEEGWPGVFEVLPLRGGLSAAHGDDDDDDDGAGAAAAAAAAAMVFGDGEAPAPGVAGGGPRPDVDVTDESERLALSSVAPTEESSVTATPNRQDDDDDFVDDAAVRGESPPRRSSPSTDDDLSEQTGSSSLREGGRRRARDDAAARGESPRHREEREGRRARELRKAQAAYSDYVLRDEVLEAALAKVAQLTSALQPEEAFELLFASATGDGRVAGRGLLPCRANASPLFFSDPTSTAATAYVVCRRLAPSAADHLAAAAAAVGGGCSTSWDVPPPPMPLSQQQQQQQQQQPPWPRAPITVSFQSAKNSEVWWSPFFRLSPGGEAVGVASRPMSRSERRRGEDSGHGYRGRMYSLVVAAGDQAESSSPPTRRDSLGGASSRRRAPSVEALGDVHVVVAWHEVQRGGFPSGQRPPPTAVAPPEGGSFVAFPIGCYSTDRPAVGDFTVPPYDLYDAAAASGLQPGALSLAAAPPPPAYESYAATFTTTATCRDTTSTREAKRLRTAFDLDDAAAADAPASFEPVFASHATVPNGLRVKGDLWVEGTIYGRLAAPGADYAEFFDLAADAGEDSPLLAGSVVQLRSPDLVLTEDTSGEGPCLVVSAAPAVAGRVPTNAGVRERRGAYVAFLGQVPVRCRGAVRAGDFLVPSRRNDGTAVAAARRADGRQHRANVLGFALTATSAWSGGGKNMARLRVDEAMNDDKDDGDKDDGKDGDDDKDGESMVLCFVRWCDEAPTESFAPFHSRSEDVVPRAGAASTPTASKSDDDDDDDVVSLIVESKSAPLDPPDDDDDEEEDEDLESQCRRRGRDDPHGDCLVTLLTTTRALCVVIVVLYLVVAALEGSAVGRRQHLGPRLRLADSLTALSVTLALITFVLACALAVTFTANLPLAKYLYGAWASYGFLFLLLKCIVHGVIAPGGGADAHHDEVDDDRPLDDDKDDDKDDDDGGFQAGDYADYGAARRSHDDDDDGTDPDEDDGGAEKNMLQKSLYGRRERDPKRHVAAFVLVAFAVAYHVLVALIATKIRRERVPLKPAWAGGRDALRVLKSTVLAAAVLALVLVAQTYLLPNRLGPGIYFA